jgi:hypothetical protein
LFELPGGTGRFIAERVSNGSKSQRRLNLIVFRRTTTTPHDANPPAGPSRPNQNKALNVKTCAAAPAFGTNGDDTARARSVKHFRDAIM